MSIEALLKKKGYSEKDLPKIAGSYAGKGLVVCGDASCIWEDLEALGARMQPHSTSRGGVRAPDGWHFMVVNKLGETFPGDIEHWYSNEAELLGKFIKARRSEYKKEFEGPKHTHSMQNGAKWRWPIAGHGTSGLSAVFVGLMLGYDKIIVAGMPLDNGPHNGEPHWRQCRFETAETASPKDYPDTPNIHWKFAMEEVFEGRVKSLSGRTRKWLGAP